MQQPVSGTRGGRFVSNQHPAAQKPGGRWLALAKARSSTRLCQGPSPNGRPISVDAVWYAARSRKFRQRKLRVVRSVAACLGNFHKPIRTVRAGCPVLLMPGARAGQPFFEPSRFPRLSAESLFSCFLAAASRSGNTTSARCRPMGCRNASGVEQILCAARTALSISPARPLP